MTTPSPMHVRRRGLGSFLAASCCTVHDGSSRYEAVVVLWTRAMELRSITGPRLLPRASVQGIREEAEGSVLSIETPGGRLRLEGRDLAPLSHRLRAWVGAEDAGPFGRDEPVYGGGPGWMSRAGTRADGTLMAVPEGVVFVADHSTRAWRFAWSELRSVRGRGLQARDGSVLGGEALSAVLAARSASHDSGQRLPRGLHLTVRATTGWARGSVWLCVGPRGVSSQPVRFWSRVLGSGETQHWDWSSIRAVRGLAEDESGLGIEGRGALRSWKGTGLRALAGELKRCRWRAARSVGQSRPDRAKGRWTVCVEARQERAGAGSAAWSWGVLQLENRRLRFTPTGETTPSFEVSTDELAWKPHGAGASPSVGLWLPEGRWSVRPPDGVGFVRTFASLFGPPAAAQAPRGSGERRAGHREVAELPAWIDPWGRVPYLGPDRAVAVVEVSVSGLVFRTASPLDVGQKVSLALRIGGPVELTGATVVRELSPGTWAVRFESPPAVLVQRLGRLVGQLERDRLRAQQSAQMPLTMGG